MRLIFTIKQQRKPGAAGWFWVATAKQQVTESRHRVWSGTGHTPESAVMQALHEASAVGWI